VPFAAIVEEADVVIGLLQRLDLARDEAVEFVEIGCEVGRQLKSKAVSPGNVVIFFAFSATRALLLDRIKVGRPCPSQAREALGTRGGLA